MMNTINRHLQGSGWDEATTGICAGATGALSTQCSPLPKQGWGEGEGQRTFLRSRRSLRLEVLGPAE